MTRTLAASLEERTALRWTVAIVAAVTLARCIVLVLSPLDLYPDEAQYWWWAQTPALGYFSKPPMIAWIIWLTTTVFGGSEWAIRIASPIFHGATALLIYAIARRATSPNLSLLSALAYLTLPGVAWSSGLISTDVPLLFFWAVALYAFLRACEDARWRWPLLCGVALGLGLESKYAMLYFLPGALLAAAWSTRARGVVFGRRAVIIAMLALVLLAPNIAWNASHGFPTVAHTEANADWGRSRYSLGGAAGFLLGQFGVFGPLLMAGFVGAFWRLSRQSIRSESDLILAAFSLPPLVLILIQAFVAGANANWAATAFVSATPLAVAELARWWRGRALAASFVIDGAATVALGILLLRPAIADAVHAGNAFKREEGWRQLGAEVAVAAERARYDSIAGDNRSVVAELLYYARPRNTPMGVWTRDLNIRDHFEMTMRLEPGTRHVLLAIEPAAADRVLATFDSAFVVKRIVTAVGGGHFRAIDLYDAQDYQGPAGVVLHNPPQSSAYAVKAPPAR
ncbi:MAG TPA: glycosyltransferase family 39 protein [Rhizomicrobium sp.]